jgi:ubiquinone/menaquinone biosynthesis C-methylase UbiE
VPPADVVTGLSGPWPWPDSSIEEIRAYDIIEHLPDKIHTMNEAWRVLKPGGLFDIEVPTTDGAGAWCDPTHVSYWNRSSFDYYTAGNACRERFDRYYGVVARFRVKTENLQRLGPVVKLKIVLECAK